MQIIVTNDRDSVEALIADGWCPVECSIGGESLVDELVMDHHGKYAYLESVAVRAYRDHFGARRSDPRFVVVGVPDADATFCIASLAGILSHPSVDVTGMPPFLHATKTKDWSGLAETVGICDTDPIGRDIASMTGGEILLTWNALMAGSPNDSLDGYAGVQLWRQLTAGHPALNPLLASARQTEADRRAAAAKEDLISLGKVAYLRDSHVFGFDVWYGRQVEHPANAPEGWRHPVVLSRNSRNGAITIGCPNTTVAVALFGETGLRAVFPKLDEAVAQGWGGRESIGGSPRGMKMTVEQVAEAAMLVEEMLRFSE